MTPLRRVFFLFCLCFAGILIVACTSTTPNSPGATNGSQPTAYADLPLPAIATMGPEIKRFSGQGNNAETIIKLTQTQILRINWKQNCISNFYLSMINTDPTLGDDDESEIVLSVAANPSYGYMDYEFEPGTYQINIASDGPWEIWVDNVVQEQEIEITDEP